MKVINHYLLLIIGLTLSLACGGGGTKIIKASSDVALTDDTSNQSSSITESQIEEEAEPFQFTTGLTSNTLIGFEDGNDLFNWLTVDESGDLSFTKLVQTQDPARVFEGDAALEFTMNKGDVPAATYFKYDFNRFEKISYKIFSTTETTWITHFEDNDAASFISQTTIPALEWVDITLNPNHFKIKEDSVVQKEQLDPLLVHTGIHMYDLSPFLYQDWENAIYIDNFSVVKQALKETVGNYEVDNETVVLEESLRIRGDLILKNNADLTVNSEILEIDGSIIVDNSNLTFDGGRWIMNQKHRYHLNQFASNGSRIVFKNGTLQLYYSYEATLSSNSTTLMDNVDLVGGGYTYIISEGCEAEINNFDHAGEFLVTDQSTLKLNSSDDNLVWLHTIKGDYEATFPDGENIEHWTIDKEKSGRSIEINSSSDILWGVITRSHSNLIIRDSKLRSCGLSFIEESGVNLSNIHNNSQYSDRTIKSSNLSLQLINSEVKAWTYYVTYGDLALSDCTFGEALAFDQSSLYIYRSTCDGTGGYIGAQGISSVTIDQSNLACDITTFHEAIIRISNSNIEGRIEVTGDSYLSLENTNHFGPQQTLEQATIEIK